MPLHYEPLTVKQRLGILYDEDDALAAYEAIKELVAKYSRKIESKPYKLSEKDAILITYGNQVIRHNEAPLETLRYFLEERLDGIINSVHILPFYPYSSDDGFSVIDYKDVSPLMGEWRDIRAIGKNYRLMFDSVINHVSRYSYWFKGFLADDPKFKDFFIEVDPSTDLSQVVRPRTTPLLSEFYDDEEHVRYIWTTFSKDQVDLNYRNYKVLLAVLDALFYYIQQGATILRLDAIAFVWKEVGTSCVHLPQTHELIQLMREVLHLVAPEVIIITETNVPHDENISYFGSGQDEAQMVYNFALPPILAHAVLTQNATMLQKWAKTLALPSDKVCFFNFTASHDGIGLRAASGILSDEQIDFLVKTAEEHGGMVSYRDMGNGEKKPYELNCNYMDLLTHPDGDKEVRIKRMLLAQAVMLAMPGVPGIYFHSLIGGRNYHDGVQRKGFNRAINREKFNLNYLEAGLEIIGSVKHRVFAAFKRAMSIRTREKAFNPFGPFDFPDLHPQVFAIRQICLMRCEHILALHNFSDQPVEIELPGDLPLPLEDLFKHETITERRLVLERFAIVWLKSVAVKCLDDLSAKKVKTP